TAHALWDLCEASNQHQQQDWAEPVLSCSKATQQREIDGSSFTVNSCLRQLETRKCEPEQESCVP
ncbi:hypothetical protein GBF38_014388, partial [Nibea albiflora]